MQSLSQASIIEAVLFAAGVPLPVQKLAEIVQAPEWRIQEILGELEQNLCARGSGTMLRCVAGGYQLVTHAEAFPFVQKLSDVVRPHLSSAAMETLSIIAYKQPITKQEIEHIRGVRVERALQKLLEMELVEEVGRKPVIGRPILYGTTDVFLKCFGLNALSDLPALPALEEVAEEGDVQLELIAADEAASVEAEASLENAAGESSGSSTAENVENAEKIGEALPLEEKSD